VSVTGILLVTATVFLWGLVSRRLERADLTAPIVFTLAGAAIAGLGLVDAQAAPATVRRLVEVTLVWVLFSDAARVRDFRRDLGRYVRLLAVGLPLTILAGWGLATWIFPDLGLWPALLVAAALAPTDAALGLPVVTDTAVPSRVRRLVAVESGLNDGIATPVVVLALAGSASAEGLAGAPGPVEALVELGIGAVVGAALGYAGGALLRRARDREWADEEFVGISVLALALAAYAAALALNGNGFVAAFCGGLAFGAAARRRAPAELVFLEQASGLVSLLVWLAFGALVVPLLPAMLGVATVLYAVLSLTVVRMVPVALCLVGAGFDRRTVAFIAWFGPRGLASLVFALLALEELGPDADEAVVVIGTTVFLSVLAHGLSSRPLAAWYGATAGEPGPPVAVPRLRHLPERRSGTSGPPR
jgi:NhaP-type Na+/H+ or K+/H+ antiporter